MTTTADTAAEKAFEALLAGRPAPPEAGGLSAFTQAVRATATQPGRPNQQLAELLTNGLVVDQPALPPKAVRRPRGRMRFFTALTGISPASAAVRVAAGAGIVVAGFTGAGAVGVLPAGAQHTFAHLLEAGTSLHAPDSERTVTTETERSEKTRHTPRPGASETPATEGGAETLPAADAPPGYDCDPTKPFGVCVSQHSKAQDGPLTPGQKHEWAEYYATQRADRPQQPGRSQAHGSTGADGAGAGQPSVGGSAGQKPRNAYPDPSRGGAPAPGRR